MSNIDYEKELNKEQLSAVKTIDGPLRIIAGAGSGKTRTLIYRVAWMLEHGIDPRNILLLTFTNKAADEMMSRAESMLDDRCGDVTACTFHSFCVLVLRRYADSIDMSKDFTIMGTPDVIEAIDRIKSKLGYNKLKGMPKGSAIAGYISKSINMKRPIEEFLHNGDRVRAEDYAEEIKNVAREYKSYKIERNLMDYDDLLYFTEKLLAESPIVRNMTESKYQYVMVDEYQDTNSLQENILLLLTRNHHNLCVVGDDYQSIYKFRGADVNNIIDFKKKIPEAHDVTLHRNYRSDQRILDLANNVMKDHANEGIYKEMNSGYDFGQMPQLIQVDSSYDERDQVFQIIQNALCNGFTRSDIAILERSSFSSNLIEARLTQEGIPYTKAGGLKFMEKAHVQDILAFLKCIANPHNEIAFFRALKKYPAIGDTFAQRISELIIKSGYSGLVENPYKKRAFYPDMVALKGKLEEWQQMDFPQVMESVEKYYSALCERVINEMKLEDESRRDELLSENDSHSEDFNTLNIMAKEHRTLTGFLDKLTLEANIPTADDDALHISTIHSAKGLEFSIVIILDCADGIFPRVTCENEHSEDDEEELRCFYVAMTRAKNQLYMLQPKYAIRYGRMEQVALSHYLTDEEEYFELVDETGESFWELQ